MWTDRKKEDKKTKCAYMKAGKGNRCHDRWKRKAKTMGKKEGLLTNKGKGYSGKKIKSGLE
jgi:hypothetical protein